MKVYLFNAENGIYEGEDFTDDILVPGQDTIPDCATAVAPPPYRKGEVPVYLVAENAWHIRSVAAATAVEAPVAVSAAADFSQHTHQVEGRQPVSGDPTNGEKWSRP
jgi:hypothetical protein